VGTAPARDCDVVGVAVFPLAVLAAGNAGDCSGFGCCFVDDDDDDVSASSLMSVSSKPIPFICFVRFSASDMN